MARENTLEFPNKHPNAERLRDAEEATAELLWQQETSLKRLTEIEAQAVSELVNYAQINTQLSLLAQEIHELRQMKVVPRSYPWPMFQLCIPLKKPND